MKKTPVSQEPKESLSAIIDRWTRRAQNNETRAKEMDQAAKELRAEARLLRANADELLKAKSND